MQRHTGGVRGTIYRRGICPECGRAVAGASANRERSRLWLKRHKSLIKVFDNGKIKEVRTWCHGSGMCVPMDLEATQAAGDAKREAARKERERYGWSSA